MPNLNVPEDEQRPVRPPTQPMMPRRESSPATRVIIVAAVVIALAVVVYLLNSAGIIHLWGPKPIQPVVTEVATMPLDTAALAAAAAATPPVSPPTPPAKPAEKKPVTVGKGEYTLVIASFRGRKTAEEEISRWVEAGYEGMISEKTVGGKKWYRLSIGRYESRKAAAKAGKEMEHMFESGYWIDKVH